LNYRHQFHAGNFADVMKHALLVRLIRAMQRKDKGFVFVDTHAGRGAYDLARAAVGDRRARQPEWPDGVGRIWDRRDLPAELADYLDLVRAHDRAHGNLAPEPRFYPGSPALARRLARPQDRLSLWELQPAECAALRSEFGGGAGVAIEEADGYGAPRAALPPPERRALVLIDAPFEDADEWSRIRQALTDALARLPAAVCAVWYPLTARALSADVAATIVPLGRPALAVEIALPSSPAKLTGCGVAVINPPWGFEGEARGVAAALAAIFGPDGAAEAGVRWLVPDV